MRTIVKRAFQGEQCGRGRTRWQIEANVYTTTFWFSSPCRCWSCSRAHCSRYVINTKSTKRASVAAITIPSIKLGPAGATIRNNSVSKRIEENRAFVVESSFVHFHFYFTSFLSRDQCWERNFSFFFLAQFDAWFQTSRGLFLQSYEQFNFAAVNGHFAKFGIARLTGGGTVRWRVRVTVSRLSPKSFEAREFLLPRKIILYSLTQLFSRSSTFYIYIYINVL